MLVTAFFAISIPISLLVICIILIKCPAQLKRILPFYGLTLGMIAYCFNPTYEIDISRYFMQMEMCRELPFARAFDWGNDGLIVKNFLFWILSKLDDNHILPLLTVSVIYSIAAYICIDSAEGNNKKIRRAIIFQILFFPTFTVISNVRNVTAFALMIVAVYRDLYRNKRGIATILLYILPCFMHMTGFVILLLRLSIIVMKRMPVLGFALPIALPTVTVTLYERVGNISLPGNIGKIISRAIWKAYASTVNTSEYAQSWQDSRYFRMCRFVTLVLCVMIVFQIIYQYKREKEKKEYSIFVLLLSVITILWILLGTVKYWVFAYAVVLAVPPVLGSFYAYRNKHLINKAIIYLMPVLAVVRTVLELNYMRLRVDWAYLFSGMIVNNIYTVILGVMKNLR